MRRVNMLTVMTAMAFVAAGSSGGNTSAGTLLFDSAAVTVSGQSSLPMMKGGKSQSKMILPAQGSNVAQVFLVATAEDDEKIPPPRSKHCPPDKDDHHDSVQKAGDNQDTNKDKDKDKDKDHHENCGKGDDDKNP